MPKKAAIAASKPSTGNKVKKNAKTYKFPEHIPTGFVIKDTKKQEWCIQETIGTGGFGEVYSAYAVNDSSKINASNPYAIKVEPKDNGPLYVEMHFYMRVAKGEEIEAWKKAKQLKSLGMPVLYGSGSFEYKSNNYRFLVTDRFGKNLQEILSENNKQFPHATVLQIGVQVLDTLEYIHAKGYIHGDIKAANMMLGMRSGCENTVYVIDFGLAAKCSPGNKEFNKDPKKVNNGTIEYISRDGHIGVFGFRGDLEILGYNLLHWLTGSLPWEKDIANASVVEQKKNDLMKNPSVYIKENIPGVSEEVIKFMEYIGSLKNNDVPDYEYCKRLFTDKLSNLRCSPYGKLVFTISKNSSTATPKKNVTSKSKKPAKRKDSSTLVNSVVPKKSRQNARKRKSVVTLKSDNEEDKKSDEEIEEEEAPKNKKSRIKKVNLNMEPSTSNNTKDNGIGSCSNCSDDDDSDIKNEIAKKSEKRSNRSNKNLKSRRSSVAFIAKKKLVEVKRVIKKRVAKENIQPEKNIVSEENDFSNENTTETSSESQKSVPKGKRNPKIASADKPSWRDAPAIVASNVKIPGVYSKTGSKSTKKKTK